MSRVLNFQAVRKKNIVEGFTNHLETFDFMGNFVDRLTQIVTLEY